MSLDLIELDEVMIGCPEGKKKHDGFKKMEEDLESMVEGIMANRK